MNLTAYWLVAVDVLIICYIKVLDCLNICYKGLRPTPPTIGFALGKIAAEVAWYGMEASARRGLILPTRSGLSAQRAHHGWLLLVKWVSVSMSSAL